MEIGRDADEDGRRKIHRQHNVTDRMYFHTSVREYSERDLQ